jgi:hypothetical protein
MTSINFQMLIECGKHADAMVYTMVHHQSFNLETPPTKPSYFPAISSSPQFAPSQSQLFKAPDTSAFI